MNNNLNKPISDVNTNKIIEISAQLGRLDTKLWVIIFVLVGLLIVAIADL